MMPLDKLEKSCNHLEYVLSRFLNSQGRVKTCCKKQDVILKASFDSSPSMRALNIEQNAVMELFDRMQRAVRGELMEGDNHKMNANEIGIEILTNYVLSRRSSANPLLDERDFLMRVYTLSQDHKEDSLTSRIVSNVAVTTLFNFDYPFPLNATETKNYLKSLFQEFKKILSNLENSHIRVTQGVLRESTRSVFRYLQFLNADSLYSNIHSIRGGRLHRLFSNELWRRFDEIYDYRR
jgi:hypothetical protein